MQYDYLTQPPVDGCTPTTEYEVIVDNKHATPIKVGSHYLHSHLNELNAEKSQPSSDLNPRQYTV